MMDETGMYQQGLHGGEIYRAAARMGIAPRQLLDFSSNANILAQPLTEKIIKDLPYPFLHYPESDSAALREHIALHERTEPENILCGNGAAELIWQLLRHLAPRSALMIGPAFSEYARACAGLGIRYSILAPKAEKGFACAEEDLRRIWESRAELTIICTPNNPAGITYDNMPAILRVLQSPRLLMDLSYRELIYDTPLYAQHNWHSYLNMVNPGTQVFCLHSFTKFFCCPGIRLGYLVGDLRHIQKMQSLQAAWSISAFAQEAGKRFLENIQNYRSTLPKLRLLSCQMGMELRRLAIFNPDLIFEGPNFFCCGLAYSSSNASRRLDGRPLEASSLQAFLLQQHFLVRDCDNIPGMPAGFIRVQVRGAEDNQKLLNTLQSI